MCCETEDWRDIPGFPDYRVSNHGRVMSYKRNEAKLVKGTMLKLYRAFCLRAHGDTRMVTARRLVMLAFVGARPDGHEIRALDGNALNTRLCNLVYAPNTGIDDITRKNHEEQGWGFWRDVIDEKQRWVLREYIARRRIERVMELIAGGASQLEAGRRVGWSKSQVSRVLRGERWARKSKA